MTDGVAGIDPAELQSKYGWDPATFRSMMQSYIGQAVPQAQQGGGEGGGISQPAPITDPNLQKLIDQGFIQQGGHDFFGSTRDANGENSTGGSTYGLNPNMMPQSNGQAYSTFQDSPKSGAKLLDPSAVWDDPIYGKGITKDTNIWHGDKSLLDTIGPMIPMLAMGMPAMFEGGGLGSLFGGQGLAGSMAKAGEGIVKGLGEDQGFNPMSLAGGVAGMFGGGLGIPPNIMQFIGPALSLAQGKGINPFQLAMQLAKQAGH